MSDKEQVEDKKPVIKSRRKKTGAVACVHCSRAHISCDSQRPCKRCVFKGLTDTCVDAPRKRRKYLIGIPAESLPMKLKDDDGSVDGLTKIEVGEKQHFYNPTHIGHKSKFLSDAANSEYSMLSSLLHQDGYGSKVSVDNMLYHDSDSSVANSTTNSSVNLLSQQPSSIRLNADSVSVGSGKPSPDRSDLGLVSPGGYTPSPPTSNSNNIDHINQPNVPTQKYPSSFQNVYSILLGDHATEIVNAKINLFANHFPLEPVDTSGNKTEPNSLSFKRLVPLDPGMKHGDLQKNQRINQLYLNNETMTFPEVKDTYTNSSNLRVSFALECSSPETTQIKNNPEWGHSLRYSTPMEIYTMINEPFSHTPGFHHLLMYLRSRFDKQDILEMCRSMAEFRPIFIACSVTLTEEDMIFMEQCYQRTLLEYAKFLEQIGTPTCVWRRNGQISYINEEFEILTGWKREELLNKMTFIVEILDDDSVRDYFKTFSSVAYKDFKGTETMKTCRVLSPVKGNVINCVCMWTLKRDISGLPLMILGNFMPILPMEEAE